MSHESGTCDWVPGMCLISNWYLSPPVATTRPIDRYMSCRSAPKWRFSIPMVEIVVAALKDVRQPKPNLPIPFDEIDGELKHGVYDITTDIDFVHWDPSPLRHNSTLTHADVVVQWQHHVLGRNPWRW